jgi:DNA-directed RNA polymerase specialized sigma24 family protein
MPARKRKNRNGAQADRARLRLAKELVALPRWGSPALWSRLRSHDPETSASSGALVSYLRLAMRRDELPAARELFVLLLGRAERLNREWARRTVARTPSLRGDMVASVRDDLLQELTLQLWSEMAYGNDEAWEIFFTRALSFAQRHVAVSYMEGAGYWIAPDVRNPSRGTAIPFSQLAARCEEDERAIGEWLPLVAPEDGMVAAELADLRDLVGRLPKRQRTLIIMRYWQDALEQDIAATLKISPRAVRSMLARTHANLRAAYEKAAQQ